MKNTRIPLMINNSQTAGSQVIRRSAWYTLCVTAAYCRMIEIDTTSMFSNHRAPCLFSLIIQSESESVFDQSLAPYPGTDKKSQAVQRRGQTPPCIYPCISISLMIIHVQSLYNSLEEAKCWAFIIGDLSEHYCFCCMKQTLQAIIMIIIIYWETRSTQIGSMSVIKRCTPFLKGGEWSFHAAFKI